MSELCTVSILRLRFGIVMTAEVISSGAVQAAVQRYWRVLMDKVAGEMETLYTHDASVFNPFGARHEPGRLSAARKERQYFSPKTSFRAELGPIDVNVLADNVAVATYTFRWYATSMAENAITGAATDKAVRDGRGTQIFILDSNGALRIVHEHLSDIWRDEQQAAHK